MKYLLLLANWFIYKTYVLYTFVNIVSDRPGFKYLNRHVVVPIAPKWYDVGLELMEIEDEKELDAIQAEQSINSDKERAKKMLKLWLDKNIDASWNDLLKALKMPTIGLNAIALEIQNLLVPESTFLVNIMNALI